MVCAEQQRRHGPASLEGCTSAAEPNKPFFEASRDYGEERRTHVLQGQDLGMNSAVRFISSATEALPGVCGGPGTANARMGWLWGGYRPLVLLCLDSQAGEPGMGFQRHEERENDQGQTRASKGV